MADIRLTEPIQPVRLSSILALRAVVGVEEFFERWRERRREAYAARWLALSRDEQADYLCKAMGCGCRQVHEYSMYRRRHSQCNHRISDIMGQ